MRITRSQHLDTLRQTTTDQPRPDAPPARHRPVQDGFEPGHRGVFLAGDDVSWTPGWVEGAVQTALNAVWGIVAHLGGRCPPSNPGPGDRWAELAPPVLPE